MNTQANSQPVVEKLLYRPREAAIAAGTSPSWIYARIADGSLKSVRLAGRLVRVRKLDLLNFIEEQQHEAR